MPKHKDFTDFLWDKFFKEYPYVLDDDCQDKFDEWKPELDVDTLIRWADEYKAES